MADRSQESVYCHACHNRWHRAEHGLECPACHSECVEIIDAHPNSSETDADDVEEMTGANTNRFPYQHVLGANPFHNHHPWGHMTPDPEEGDISHVEWNPTPGMHFSRTSYRTTSPRRIRAAGSPPLNDPFAQLFQSFSTMMEDTHDSRDTLAPPPFYRPALQYHANDGGGLDSHPLRPRDVHTPQPNTYPVDTLQGLLGNLLRGVHETQGGAHFGPQMPPLNLFAQLLNPANARHGDAVYSEEALDRIITQFMEAQNGSSAPGPASAAAIAALPKKKINESMLGSDGKAECSVCMDNVNVGDEVTVLPCGHWFHGECVGAWLKEHDTCPHCRQGIMPKTSGAGGVENTPRLPGQAPRISQPPLSPGHENGFQFAWHQPSSNSASPSRQESHSGWSRHDSRSRRRSGARNGGEGSSSGTGNGGGGGGLSGWVRSHFGSSNNQDSS